MADLDRSQLPSVEAAKAQQHVRAAARDARQAERTGIELAAELAIQEASAFAKTTADWRAADDVRQVFTAAATRVTEPHTNWDRDSANQAWLDQVAAAGIANGAAPEAHQRPDTSPERETRAGAAEPSYSPQEAAGPVVETTPAPEAHRAERAASRFFGGIAAMTETVLTGLFSFFGGGEPKLTPQQSRDQARADTNEETLHARAYAAAEQEKEAATEARIFELVRQQRQDKHREDMGLSDAPAAQRKARDDYDGGYERER